MASRPLPPKLTGADLALALEWITGHAFKDRDRVERALTHASVRNANGLDYERFEFLGDRVLGMVVADLLFHHYPQAPEGELSLRLNGLVNAEMLATIADEIGLPDLVRVGGELRGRKNVNLRADSLEALIAALYLDGGLDAARNFILKNWSERAANPNSARRDAKTELQEWAHQYAKATPAYRIDSRIGPDHDPMFTVAVEIPGHEPAFGTGRSRRDAEQAAAGAVLLREGVWRAQDLTA